MKSIEEKKAAVDDYLIEKKVARRNKLEGIISGKAQLKRFSVTLAIGMVVGFGLLLCLFETNQLSPSSLNLVVLFLLWQVAWKMADSAFDGRIEALKEYVDLRLAEIERKE